MDQVDIELDLHHQIDQPGHEMPALQEDEALETRAELSSLCDDAEHCESPQGSPDTPDPPLPFSPSGDAAPASEPAGEVVSAEEVSESMAVDFKAMIAKDDTVGAAMAETGDAECIVAEENGTMAVEAVDSVPVKRKRGRPRKNPEARAAPPVRKKEREDVCFVCFDRTNPNLVACNRRGCYKAYHPACVNRDEAFFRSKSKWNCGWHICSTCQKAAHYMCYTCTTSYCKECIIDESKYVCVRGTYGFCQSCHNTVTLIELNKLAFEMKDGSDFDDTDSFTYLFKAYWLDQKGKLSLTSEELNNAKHPYSVAPEEDSSDELYDVNEDQGYSSESSSGDHKSSISSKKKVRSRSQSFAADKNPAKEVDGGGTIMFQEAVWASKELLELVAHMRNGDQSFISQFDVQALLLDYIKKYNLRDPRKKSQIICDLRLQNLFGKERVGHFEMLKLLESHFLSKEAPQVVADGNQVETSDPDNKLNDDVEEGDTFARIVSDKRRKNRKRTEEIEPQTNFDDYAAVDVHNITQIFLRRSLVEELLHDIETFNYKVVGSFVRIRISNAGQKQDLYRLVQVVGTQEGSKPYKVGKKTTDFVLEILNLDKKETSTIDSISNQDFTEEECQRLRQSIKCGLINRLKVGYIQEKAKVLHAVRVNDSIETEKLRLSHLRDRASETGRRKELRECVEKLQLLNNPEERRRKLNEVPQIHADPKMDPDHESSEEGEDDKNQDYHIRLKKTLSLRKGRELIPRGRAGTIGNNWNSTHKGPIFNRESSRTMRGEVVQDRSDMHNNMVERPNEILQNQSKEMYHIEASFTGIQTPSPVTPGGSLPSIPNEVDKVWHYQDPSKNIQGPFSLSQLRKWNTTGYFPPDLRIWITSEKPEDSHLLADALAGNFYKDQPQLIQHSQPTWADMQQPSLDSNPRPSALTYNNPYHNPTYQETGRRGSSSGGWNPDQDYGNIWSPTRPRDGLTSETPVISGSSIANELNAGMNKYRSFESDCPSPTPSHWPETLDKLAGAPLGTPDSSVSSKFQNNLSPIAATADDIRYSALGSGHSQMSELSPIRKRESEFQAMDSASVQKRFPVCSSPTPPPLNGPEHHQAQNSKSSFSPIHQVNDVESSLPSPTPKSSKNSWGIDASSASRNVPSQSQNAQTVQNANASWGGAPQGNAGWGAPAYATANDNEGWGTLIQGNSNANTGCGAVAQGNATANTSWGTPDPNANTGWGTPVQGSANANTGWGTPVQVNTNANTGWGTPVQGNANANTGWGTPVQGNANANTGWGTPVQGSANANTGWGTPVQVNTNANTGWGTPVQGNANANTGWGTPVQGNANANANTGWGVGPKGNGWSTNSTTTVWGNANPGATGEAIPRHEDDANARAGWGSAHGNRNGGWKSYDRDTGRHFNYEGRNANGYPHHRDRDTGRRGGGDPRNNRGGRGGSSRPGQASPGGDGQRGGVCKFYESGHCKKGRSCKYLHTDMRRDI